MSKTKLIDVKMTLATGEEVVIERPPKVAESMLTRLRYQGEGVGRYILESDREKFFTEDSKPAPEPIKGIGKEEPKDEEVLEAPEPVKAETEPEPAPKKKRGRPKKETKEDPEA